MIDLVLKSIFVAVTNCSLFSPIFTRLECPDGWTEMGERSCVKALTQRGSFEDSQTACRDLHSDAYLAIPQSAAEQQILLSLTSGWTWIGVVRAEHGKPGFVDVKGGALKWKNWKSGEPNNSGGTEDCTEVYAADGLWNDQTCSDERAAICQITKGKHMFFPRSLKSLLI